MRHESIDPAITQGRAAARRVEISLLCEVRQGLDPWRMVRLEDISQAGFRIAWLPGALENKPLRIRIPGLQVLSARICWQQDKALGCEFIEPLHVAVFEHIVRCADLAGGSAPGR